MSNAMDKLYFSTLKEVEDMSFDYIVIGAGAYGTSFAHRMLELDRNANILLLDKGTFLISEHIQNIPPAYIDLNLDAGIRPWEYKGSPGCNFMPQIPYVGGRALFWNAWIPQPEKDEMPDWPDSVIEGLKEEWNVASEYMGRRYTLEIPGNNNQQLSSYMKNALFKKQDHIKAMRTFGNPASLDSTMATGQSVPETEIAKFSPINVLIDDLYKHKGRLFVVPDSEVTQLIHDDKEVTDLKIGNKNLSVKSAKVIVAISTLESGALLARSYPDNPLVGKNLCGHMRSFLAYRVQAKNFSNLKDSLQVAAQYVPGYSKKLDRLMHVHVSGVYNPNPKQDYDLLYKTLPDASNRRAFDTYQDPNYVVFMTHAMGEFLGTRSADSKNYVTVDQKGKMLVHVDFEKHDESFWEVMDETLFQISDVLVDGAEVEYQQADGSWSTSKPSDLHNAGLVHEAGTLWMGDDPRTSVTNEEGRLHCANNVYGTGGMLFRRPGSWNPTFTGVAMVFGLARRLANEAASRRGETFLRSA